MKTHVPSPPSRTQFGPRLQLSLQFVLLIATLAAVLAIMPIGEAWVKDLVHQNLTARQLSRFASEIVVQTLLCRRYEKDILLNLSNQTARSDYLTRWNQAAMDLDRAIQGFGAAAVTAADRAQADAWRTQSANYRAAVLQTLRAIDSGSIATPEEANTLLAPAKDSIRNLTDTAMIAARDKDSALRSSSEALSSTITRNARLIVLFGVAGLLLCSALARR